MLGMNFNVGSTVLRGMCYVEMHALYACMPAATQAYDVLFYGDSIFESLRNTSSGGPCERCTGSSEVYERHFSSKFRSQVLAISGTGLRAL